MNFQDDLLFHKIIIHNVHNFKFYISITNHSCISYIANLSVPHKISDCEMIAEFSLKTGVIVISIGNYYI